MINSFLKNCTVPMMYLFSFNLINPEIQKIITINLTKFKTKRRGVAPRLYFLYYVNIDAISPGSTS